MWPLAVLTGDHINGFFFHKEMYGRFFGPKKTGRTNEVTVLSSRKVGLHCYSTTPPFIPALRFTPLLPRENHDLPEV